MEVLDSHVQVVDTSDKYVAETLEQPYTTASASPTWVDGLNLIQCAPDEEIAMLFMEAEGVDNISSIATSSSSDFLANESNNTSNIIDALLYEDGDPFDVVENTQQTIPAQHSQVQTRKSRYKRRKDELMYLRNKVAELQNDLLRLQTEKIEATHVNASQVLQTLWEAIAVQNQQESAQAIQTNLKLRAMLEQQVQVAHQLETALLLRQHKLDCELQNQQSTLITALSGRTNDCSDAITFAILAHDLVAQFPQVDARLSAWSGTNGTTANRMPHTRHSDSSFECFYSQTMPYALPIFHNALWRTITQTRIQFDEDSIYEVYADEGDTVHSKFTDILRLPTHQTTIHMLMTVRRFVEADRIVIMSNSLLELEAPLSVRFREIKWNLLTSLSDTQSMSRVCTRSFLETPLNGIKTASRQQYLGPHADFLMDLLSTTLRRRVQVLNQVMSRILGQDNMFGPHTMHLHVRTK